MSNINKHFKISKKRYLSGESNPEEDRKKKPEKEVPQPVIMIQLRMKYSNRSAQQMIFQKC